MEVFDKAVKKVKEVGSNVVTTAVGVGNSIGNVAKEQTEIASLKLKKNGIEKKLDVIYARIGKEYVTSKREETAESNIQELMEELDLQLAELDEIEGQIKEIEAKNKENSLAKERKKAETKFEAEKETLDKALAMEILTVDEYNTKLAAIQKKLDHFEDIRKIDLQYEMNIITKEEHDAKIDALLK
ncbi:MAG: hypothetical protein PUC65_08850 [Clostridiales bacterium]|nr:hypothetical protein [Clostridiales bacterium]